MRNLPTEVVVGPYSYRVSCDETEHLEAQQAESAKLYGIINHSKLILILDPEQHPTRAQATMLHEVLHAVFRVGGNEPSNEEEVIDMIASLLLHVLQQNPQLVAFLCERHVANA